jgi:hypothetical protein
LIYDFIAALYIMSIFIAAISLNFIVIVFLFLLLKPQGMSLAGAGGNNKVGTFGSSGEIFYNVL